MPYAHHQKKTLIKQAAREVAQSLSEARNLAINWLSTLSWANLNVWIYFAPEAKQIDYYASTGVLNIDSLPTEIYKIKLLPKGTQVDLIWWAWSWSLISFSAIYGGGDISPGSFTGEILINISYKWANTTILQKEITYYTKSFISDY